MSLASQVRSARAKNPGPIRVPHVGIDSAEKHVVLQNRRSSSITAVHDQTAIKQHQLDKFARSKYQTPDLPTDMSVDSETAERALQ